MQLSLPLLMHDIEYESDDFIQSCCNISAYKAIREYHSWPEQRMLLIGPEGSGKTHLATIWQNLTEAQVIDYETNLEEINKSAIILENIERIRTEDFLFHIINFAKENSIALLMTAEYYPPFTLPDLQSRLNATYKTLIKNPDNDLLQVILLKRFSDRQLKVSTEVLRYIFTRTHRNFAYIKNLVDKIDQISMEERRNITIPLVKKVLEQYMPENMEDEPEHTD